MMRVFIIPTQTLPCLHRGNVTQHVWSNDRGSQSAPFMGHSNRPVTESGIKWNMKILFFFFMVSWHKAENAWLVGQTATQLEWVRGNEQRQRSFAEGWFCIHFCNFSATWQHRKPKTKHFLLKFQDIVQHARTPSACWKMHRGMHSRSDHTDHIRRWSWPIDPILLAVCVFRATPKDRLLNLTSSHETARKKATTGRMDYTLSWFSCGSL